jgi:hypothetical protein
MEKEVAQTIGKVVEQSSCQQIHRLYQELYLTDLKQEITDQDFEISRQKELNLMKTQDIDSLRHELATAKRTI